MVGVVIYCHANVSTGCDCIINFVQIVLKNTIVLSDRDYQPLKMMNGTNVKLKFYNL